jgi:hypothetical protein
MDILAWIAWALFGALRLVWSLVWFLISGWVSTLLQIGVLVAVAFVLIYGWQRAPMELWRRGRAFALFVWGWLRSSADAAASQPAAIREVTREVVRTVRVKEMGDINLSTLLSLLMLAGLALVAALA